MRVLHVVKTADGALWAANQAAELVRRGVEVHVALPHADGRAVPYWVRARVRIHTVDLDFPIRGPWKLPAICRAARRLVADIHPDLVHSHFFGTTMVLRQALKGHFSGPVIFQVAGPLHLEHAPYRALDLQSAGPNDYWIASSRCILARYLGAGISRKRVFLSYHGGSSSDVSERRTNFLRSRLGISDQELVVGNINFMYPPKRFLGQTVGVKCHEDVIDALSIVTRDRPDVTGVFVGETFGGATWYEANLRARAWNKAGAKVRFAGYLSPVEIASAWPDFDVAVHVPLSENCGGVLEPLLAGVPTIAGRVGGLPELVIEGVTGKTVPKRNPIALAQAINEVLSDLPRYRELAQTGSRLARAMFDVSRTGAEIHAIYRSILDPECERPAEFASADFAVHLSKSSLSLSGGLQLPYA
jgi:glycosyltransferase involved in cell wall biosynthesis